MKYLNPDHRKEVQEQKLAKLEQMLELLDSMIKTEIEDMEDDVKKIFES